MKRHIVVNDMDLTPYVVNGSYKINASDRYESWEDGNLIEHRIIVGSKVNGSFKIACGGELSLADFMANWSAAVDNGVLTIGLYVLNIDSFEALECYFEIENDSHILTAGGKWIDVLDIKIKER